MLPSQPFPKHPGYAFTMNSYTAPVAPIGAKSDAVMAFLYETDYGRGLEHSVPISLPEFALTVRFKKKT